MIIISPCVPDALLDDVRNLIRQARSVIAQAVNSALVLLYWQIGQRIRTEILKEKRAEYGEEILPTLSANWWPISAMATALAIWPA